MKPPVYTTRTSADDGRMPAHSFCSFCGARFPEGAGWPRRCPACNTTTYRNPLPVAVVLVPVEDGGLLLIRRAIEPRTGKLALPGGYVNDGETWQEAAAREVREETGITVAAESIREFQVRSAPDGTVLLFGISDPIERSAIVTYQPTEETSDCLVIDTPSPDMAFPLHAEAVRAYFNGQNGMDQAG